MRTILSNGDQVEILRSSVPAPDPNWEGFVVTGRARARIRRFKRLSEAAELYPFDETRRALYEGGKRAVAAIGRCKPYKLSLPIQAKKEHLVFDSPDGPGRRVSKEGVIEDVLKLLDF